VNLATYAAFAAAAISLINLVFTTTITGRREKAKWARDAMTDSFYQLLNASFSCKDAASRYRNLVNEASSDAQLNRQREIGEHARAQIRERLTHLRLLASAQVVDAANELRRRSERLAELAIDVSCSDTQYANALTDLTDARRVLLSAAKRELKLPGRGV
jgi:hypothetical protein